MVMTRSVAKIDDDSTSSRQGNATTYSYWIPPPPKYPEKDDEQNNHTIGKNNKHGRRVVLEEFDCENPDINMFFPITTTSTTSTGCSVVTRPEISSSFLQEHQEPATRTRARTTMSSLLDLKKRKTDIAGNSSTRPTILLGKQEEEHYYCDEIGPVMLFIYDVLLFVFFYTFVYGLYIVRTIFWAVGKIDFWYRRQASTRTSTTITMSRLSSQPKHSKKNYCCCRYCKSKKSLR